MNVEDGWSMGKLVGDVVLSWEGCCLMEIAPLTSK